MVSHINRGFVYCTFVLTRQWQDHILLKSPSLQPFFEAHLDIVDA